MPEGRVADLKVDGHVVRVIVSTMPDGTVLAYPEESPHIVAKARDEDTALKLLGDVLVPPPAREVAPEDTRPGWQFWEDALS